jgi:hypothetical protein
MEVIIVWEVIPFAKARFLFSTGSNLKKCFDLV